MQKFRDVLGRWERRELSALEAGELLGCSERQFRRWRRRYEEEGLDGLVDRRLGKASPRRVPIDEIAWLVEAYRTRPQGWTVSQRIRKRIEEAFGWIKGVAGQQKTRFRGVERVGFAFTFAAASYNLIRLSKLLAASP